MTWASADKSTTRWRSNAHTLGAGGLCLLGEGAVRLELPFQRAPDSQAVVQLGGRALSHSQVRSRSEPTEPCRAMVRFKTPLTVHRSPG